MKRAGLAAIAAALVAAATLAVPALAAPQKTALTASVGPGFTITLTKAGKKVTTLKPGAYVITVSDKSAFHNFLLSGPGVTTNT